MSSRVAIIGLCFSLVAPVGLVDAQPSEPLDAVTEIVRETGKLVFVRGMVEQTDHQVAAFSGIIRKFAPR